MDAFHFCVDSSYITVTWRGPTALNDLKEKLCLPDPKVVLSLNLTEFLPLAPSLVFFPKTNISHLSAAT